MIKFSQRRKISTATNIAVLVLVSVIAYRDFRNQEEPVVQVYAALVPIIVSNKIVPLKIDYASSSLPVRLKIPVIDVDTMFEYMGITSNGEMGVPKGPDNVSWYKLGPRPGDVGSAVIAGHFGWKNNIPAVFDNLHKLKSGDKIFVEDSKGLATTFVVREVRLYNENNDATHVFVSDDGKSHLNLITCEGTWNSVSKRYSNRLVVFADKE